MYFGDSWSFIVQTENNLLIPVDLQEEDDWGDIEPVCNFKDGTGFITIGKEKDPGYRDTIISVWEYMENKPFDGKFSTFYPIDIKTFVRRLIDAGVAFHDQTEEDAEELKKHYGV